MLRLKRLIQPPERKNIPTTCKARVTTPMNPSSEYWSVSRSKSTNTKTRKPNLTDRPRSMMNARKRNIQEMKIDEADVDEWYFEKCFKKSDYFKSQQRENTMASESDKGINAEYFDSLMKEKDKRDRPLVLGSKAIRGSAKMSLLISDESLPQDQMSLDQKEYKMNRRINRELIQRVARKKIETLFPGCPNSKLLFSSDDDPAVIHIKKNTFINSVRRNISHFKNLKTRFGTDKNEPERLLRIAKQGAFDISVNNSAQSSFEHTKRPPIQIEIEMYEAELKKLLDDNTADRLRLIRTWNEKGQRKRMLESILWNDLKKVRTRKYEFVPLSFIGRDDTILGSNRSLKQSSSKIMIPNHKLIRSRSQRIDSEDLKNESNLTSANLVQNIEFQEQLFSHTQETLKCRESQVEGIHQRLITLYKSILKSDSVVSSKFKLEKIIERLLDLNYKVAKSDLPNYFDDEFFNYLNKLKDLNILDKVFKRKAKRSIKNQTDNPNSLITKLFSNNPSILKSSISRAIRSQNLEPLGVKAPLNPRLMEQVSPETFIKLRNSELERLSRKYISAKNLDLREFKNCYLMIATLMDADRAYFECLQILRERTKKNQHKNTVQKHNWAVEIETIKHLEEQLKVWRGSG